MKKGTNKRTGQDMRALGAAGGKGNKDKPSTRDKCSKAGKAAWANVTAEERSEIARERARKMWISRRKGKK